MALMLDKLVRLTTGLGSSVWPRLEILRPPDAANDCAELHFQGSQGCQSLWVSHERHDITQP